MSEELLTIEELESRQIFAKIQAANAKARESSLQPAAAGAIAPLNPPPNSPAPAPPGLGGFDPAFGLQDLVDVWYLMHPDVELYPWQREELLRLSGHLSGSINDPRFNFTAAEPCMIAHPCANGSGKDMALITTAAIGLPLLYRDVLVVITSASNEQLKHQTENHICRGIEALNGRLGQPIYESIHYYHRCPSRGGEIKLFATDEAGRAEGWHPMTQIGRLVIIVNEAKSITPEIFTALDRCHGFTHWMEISSPGPRRGMFYDNVKKAVKHPLPLVPGKYYSRKVDVRECPHISPQAIARLVDKWGEDSYIVQTSLRANFHEEEKDVVIPAGLLEACSDVVPDQEGTIGIGLDCAAGGDETALVVRRGARVLDKFYFHEKNTEKAYDLINHRLDPYRFEDYVFNLDDGGIGSGFAAALLKRGWNVIRRHSQSAAYDKQHFANLGAEMWWHVRDLFQARLLARPDDDILYTQLVTRRDNMAEGLGKHKLDSKKRIKEIGGSSPDRADAFVLAFFSFKPKLLVRQDVPKPETPQTYTVDEIHRLLRRNPNFGQPDLTPKHIGSPYYSSL